jgi:hypothetical protein
MTREEAIKWLESLKAEIGKSEHRTLWHYAEGIDMAIEALTQPIVAKCYEIEKDYIYCSPETAEVVCNALHLYHSTNVQNMHNADLISRADAVKAICDKCLEEHCETECIVPCTFMEALEAVPSADAVHIETYRELYEKYVDLKHASADTKHNYEPGQWQTEDGRKTKAEYSVYCSKCGSWSEYRTKYCGNCGSLMKEENDEQ